MEQEVAPMLKMWRRETLAHEGRGYRLFRSPSGSEVYVACGIGRGWGMKATEALIAAEDVQAIISAGFAGALTPERKIGDLIEPGTVIDAETGDRFASVNGGNLALVSASQVVGRETKKQLTARYGAEAVDMEAAAVARIAQQHEIAFYAIKSISDELEFLMPPFNHFINRDGGLEMARFAVCVALRPQYWPSVVRLGINSRRAAAELCKGLVRVMADISSGRKSIVNA